jgi:hypothetical protein
VTAPAWLPWLGSVGVTLIIATGKVFAPLRERLLRTAGLGWLGKLLSCALCTGFWVGLATGLALGYRAPAEVLWSGGAVALLSLVADVLIERLEGGDDEDRGGGAGTADAPRAEDGGGAGAAEAPRAEDGGGASP